MTQQYTPVTWQDETTSQQGTLINAERLNQMQTAHHYADGFEEVDAVPTADPGVDYHKIVYCTADNTLYRWDGTEWTADIDDETKRLLEEEIARATEAERTIQGYLDAHEANHSNPHVVTKSQVGLGNCDNTADLDKPISTATQAALDGKADKATTLAGYGITDAYTKSQVDGYLGGKVDKLGTSPAGTYKSVTVNAQGQVTAGTNPDTLAGYGITDAYTKGEADTLLAGKADVATTLAGYGITDAYTETETDTLLAAKANDNAVVHLAGAETITGAKTFTRSDSDIMMILKSRRILAGTGTMYNIRINSNDDEELGNIASYKGSQQTSNYLSIKRGSTTAEVGAIVHDTQGAYGFAPTPGASAPGNAIATLASLDNYAPMVRTTGNQEASGIKAMWTPYYYGGIASNASDNKYTDFGKFFNSNSFGSIMISIIGRADYFLGVMQASHDAEAGTLTTGNEGFKSESAKVTFYAAMLADGGHLVAKRRTAAGQVFEIQVLGISNVTSSPAVEPKLTYPDVTITDELLTEIVTI